MRIPVAAVMISVMFACATSPAAAQQAKIDDVAVESEFMYAVECRIFADVDGKTSVSAPKIQLYEGQKATINDEVQRPFVTAVRKFDDREAPHVHMIHEGIAIEVQVFADEADRFTLEAVLERTTITGVDVKNGRQSPRIRTVKKRVIECADSKSTIVVHYGEPCSTGRVEFTVTKLRN